MVINSADILKDQAGQIMNRGTGTMFLVLGDDPEDKSKARVMEVGEGEGHEMGELFICPWETLEQLKIVGNLYKLIWLI